MGRVRDGSIVLKGISNAGQYADIEIGVVNGAVGTVGAGVGTIISGSRVSSGKVLMSGIDANGVNAILEIDVDVGKVLANSRG